VDNDADGLFDCDAAGCLGSPPCQCRDRDGDGVCDATDGCLGDDAVGDGDGDGLCDDQDACPGFDDGLDVDGDGTPDGCDVETCDDALDNEGDGLVDCLDPECSAYPACVPAGFGWLPSGTFIRGSPVGEIGRNNWEVQHEVTLTRSFYIGIHEVTQAEFESTMGWNPSWFSDSNPFASYPPCPDCPVESVSWFDALAFANLRSLLDGLEHCYDFSNIMCDDGTLVGSDYLSCMSWSKGGIDDATVDLHGAATPYDCEGYRLPTGAEGEYAARAGSTTAFPNGGNLVAGTALGCPSPLTLDNGETLDSIAWFCGNSGSRTHPVGSLPPNPWGLYDTSGNVSEWNWDWHGVYPTSPVVDPSGPVSGIFRLIRGCDFGCSAGGLRSGDHRGSIPVNDARFIGIRLARSEPTAP
jgi:formylglycine-generating enzyme required for sulfatase activity